MDLWLAIDDTDNTEPDCVGTGRRARDLARELVSAGLVATATVTRHQLLVHPDIPYTSHNSAACLALQGVRAARDSLGSFAREHLLAHLNMGANPGLCAIEPDQVPSHLLDFGKRAQREVIALAEADALGASLPAFLWWHGETGQGRIGALAAVGLRHGGDDGRFIGLPGIRGLEGSLLVGEICARSPIERVETLDGVRLDDEVEIDTQDWVRPSLRGGVPVLRVRRDGERWIPEEKWRKYR